MDWGDHDSLKWEVQDTISTLGMPENERIAAGEMAIAILDISVK
jgi:hypothetical protein